MALLEADVNFKVVKQFVATVTERAIGSDVLDESLTPRPDDCQIVNEELTALIGRREHQADDFPQAPHGGDAGRPQRRRARPPTAPSWRAL